VQYVNIERCRREERNLVDLRCAIAEKALINIPWQMTAWMTKNGFKPQSKIIADPPSNEPATTMDDVGEEVGFTLTASFEVAPPLTMKRV
jgi:hypothetical protein